MQGLSLDDNDPTRKTKLELIIEASTVLTAFVEESTIEDLLLSQSFIEEYSLIDEDMALGNYNLQDIDPTVLVNTLNFMFKYNINMKDVNVIEKYILDDLFIVPTSDNLKPQLIGNALVTSNSFLYKRYYHEIGQNLREYFTSAKDVMRFEDDCFLSKEWFEFLYLRQIYPAVLSENPNLDTLGSQYLHYLITFLDTLNVQIQTRATKDYTQIVSCFEYICNKINEFVVNEIETYANQLQSIPRAFTTKLIEHGLYDLALALKDKVSINDTSVIDTPLLYYRLISTGKKEYLDLFFKAFDDVIFGTFSMDDLVGIVLHIINNADTKALTSIFNKMAKTDNYLHLKALFEKTLELHFDDIELQPLIHFLKTCNVLSIDIAPTIRTNDYVKFKTCIEEYPKLQVYHFFTYFKNPTGGLCTSKLVSMEDFKECMKVLEGLIPLTMNDIDGIINSTNLIFRHYRHRINKTTEMVMKYKIRDEDVMRLYDILHENITPNGFYLIYTYYLRKNLDTRQIVYNALQGDPSINTLIEITPIEKYPQNIWSIIINLPLDCAFFSNEYNGVEYNYEQRDKFLNSLIEGGYPLTSLHVQHFNSRFGVVVNDNIGQFMQYINKAQVQYHDTQFEQRVINDDVDSMIILHEKFFYYPSEEDIQLFKDKGAFKILAFFNKVRDYVLQYI